MQFIRVCFLNAPCRTVILWFPLPVFVRANLTEPSPSSSPKTGPMYGIDLRTVRDSGGLNQVHLSSSNMIQITLALLGLILIVISLQDAFEVVLLSRPVERQLRLVNYFFRGTWAAGSRLGRLFPSGIRREGFLGVYGPLSMMPLFICWAIAIIVGFGFLQWALQGTTVLHMRASLASWLYLSGDTFFTLGYENSPSRTGLSHILIIVEAGTGFGFIALMVSYLPVLHHDFSQRDKQIIQLDARAGTPPTVGVLLQRHAALGNLETLNLWLRDWEIWASELIESHSSYPMLAFYRYQHQNQSWLGSLALMLNCCSLVLACSEDVPVLQAESTFRVGTSSRARKTWFVMDELATLQRLPQLNDGHYGEPEIELPDGSRLPGQGAGGGAVRSHRRGDLSKH